MGPLLEQSFVSVGARELVPLIRCSVSEKAPAQFMVVCDAILALAVARDEDIMLFAHLIHAMRVREPPRVERLSSLEAFVGVIQRTAEVLPAGQSSSAMDAMVSALDGIESLLPPKDG